MGLITEEVEVTISGRNVKYFEDLGYEIPKEINKYGKLSYSHGAKIKVKTVDLQNGSSIKVLVKCDGCGEESLRRYCDYLKSVKKDGKTYCLKCATKLYSCENTRKTKLKNGKSFYQWCIENKRDDVLLRWDYELNNCSPDDILYTTPKKYWFKCDNHTEHSSELKQINNFTNGSNGVMKCKQCNSIAQYIIDNFPGKDLYDVWDKEKNGNANPWEISKGSPKKRIWIKCQEKDYHGSYNTTCDSFASGRRCPYCTNRNGKVHALDSFGQYIIDNYGEDFLNNIWSDKNKKSPFELSPGSHECIYINCIEKDYHGNYKTTCDSFIRGHRCPYCSSTKIHPKDSLGQYIIDNYGEEFLLNIWSDKNNISPFQVGIRSNKKYWWKCANGKHEDYYKSCCNAFACEFRCPKCVEEMNTSILEEKTKKYLESLRYEVLTEHNCTIRPINPKTKKPMPYDNEIILENGKHLIIEVHGEQHYNSRFHKTRYKCTKEEADSMLKYQQEKDKYKREYCEYIGYDYLEVPYTAYGKKEEYKQMIDDKIEEILKEA